MCVCVCVGKRKKNAKTHWETNKSVKQKKKNAKKDEEDEQKKKKTTKRKTKEKIIKTIWNLCAYFISFGFANAASQQLPQGHRCPGGGGVWKEESGRNILGNVLCRVLSFLRDFPPRFYFFFLFFGTHLMPFVLLIDIYDMYTYIYLYRYVYASQSGRLFLYSAWQNVFMHFLNGNWSNSSARLHDGTMARGGACVERLMRFHARQKAHEIVKNYFLSYSGNIFHSANKLNSTLVRELTNSVHLFSTCGRPTWDTSQFELSVANTYVGRTHRYMVS